MTSAVALDISTATELLQAWLADLAQTHGLAVLFIKGKSGSFHGLRPSRVSSDIDVLVHPDEFQVWEDLLAGNGWQERAATAGQDLYVTHSVSYLHPSWPLDIDLHRNFPGFLADPSTTFQALYEKRCTLRVAGVDTSITDKVSTLAILALHSLRSRDDAGRHSSELAYLLENADLTPTERDDLGSFAMITGCDRTLDDVLAHLGITRPAGISKGSEASLREWRLRVASGASTGYMWWLMLRRQKGLGRIRLFRDAVWPDRADLLQMRPGIDDSPAGRARARLNRLRSGFPGAMRALFFRLGHPHRKKDG